MARVEHALWKHLAALVHGLDHALHLRLPRFSDTDIVLTVLWARLHRQPMSWACLRESWPLHQWRRPLPSPSTLSRRIRTSSVRMLLNDVERRIAGPDQSTLVKLVDGKPMVVSKHSIDPWAKHGRGAGGKDKGFKVHAICGLDRRIGTWRVTPLNCPEPEIARRMVNADAVPTGYLVGDTNYDWDRLHRQCEAKGVRLLAPRRPSRKHKGIRERGVSQARQSCIAALERVTPGLAQWMVRKRRGIETVFARLETRWGITTPPFYVRGRIRVHLWVQSAIILDHLLNSAKNNRWP